MLARSRTALLAILIPCIAAVAIPLIVWLSHPRVDEELQWEQQHHAEMVKLKGEAEALAIAGKLPESHEKYRAIQELTAGRKIKDPLIWDMLEQCKTDQDRVFAVLMKKMERSVSPTVPQNAPAGVAETQRAIPAYPKSYSAMKAPASAPTAAASSAAPEPPVTTIVAAPDPSSPSTRPEATKRPRIQAEQGVSDEQIGKTIQKSVDFLLSNFDGPELKQVVGITSPTGHHGLNALAIYAMLEASKTLRDPRIDVHGESMRAMIEAMKKHRMESAADLQAPITYAHAMRAAALSVFNRPEDRATLKADVDWLIKSHVLGGYSYDERFVREFSQGRFTDSPIDIKNILADGKHNPDGSEGEQTPPMLPPRLPWERSPGDPKMIKSMSFPWDNSNSQMAAFGVWCAAEADIEVPTKYWQDVISHWAACQTPEGQWYYNAIQTTPTLAMTAGGVASLFIAHDWVDRGATRIAAGPSGLVNPLLTGLQYLETGDNSMQLLTLDTYYVSYTMFALERVGLATGFKYFGAHDWYRELAEKTVSLQSASGAFGRSQIGFDAVAETSFTVAFLSKGRHPILMNKLRFNGAWGNRPHDLAGLARFASRELERPIDWQVVPLDHDFTDWLNAPILYIASNDIPRMDAQDGAKLHSFVNAGGMIFTHADQASTAFNNSVEKIFSKTMFPDYPMRDIPANDPIYTCQYRMKQPPPKLRGVWNGSRWVLVHSPVDLAANWQARNEKSARAVFELGMNLFRYATGNVELRNRMTSPYFPPSPQSPATNVKVAKLTYKGNWNPEPFAWLRFDRWLQRDSDIGLQLLEMPVDRLTPQSTSLAVLTGTAAFAPTDAQIAALHAYVDEGGWLLIDCCGGSPEFADWVQNTLMPKLAQDGKLEPLAATDALLQGDAAKPQYRPETLDRFGADGVRLRSMPLGKGRILFSSIDITSGLLGTNTLGISGYQPDSSCSLAKNVILQVQKAAQ